VYIEVQRREEVRKSQGLPPRLGVLRHSAVAEFVAPVGRIQASHGKKIAALSITTRANRNAGKSFLAISRHSSAVGARAYD